MAVTYGAVARDDTGAADLAGMLADRGMRPILVMAEPWHGDFLKWTRDADAVVIATPSRFDTGDIAYEETRRAIRLLQSVDPALLHIKYSSTLGSAESDIGSSIDAAMDETHQEFTVALPDFPVHPESRDSLLAQLQGQTKRRVAVASRLDTAQGVAGIRQRLAHLHATGVEIAILDFASEDDLPIVCEAISDLRLVTGSSVLASRLPTSWAPLTPVYPQRRNGGRGFLVVAGSDSPVTRSQNEWLAAHHAVAITLDALNLAMGILPDSVLTPISEELASGGTCLLHASADSEILHDYLRQQNKSVGDAKQSIARSLASFVRDLMSFVTPEGLIVAGSHTASILSHLLGFGALAVGPNIEPGIPVCVTLSGSALPVVLKSGSRGTETFYQKAIETIRSLEYLKSGAAPAN